jgi:hypothetical protein
MLPPAGAPAITVISARRWGAGLTRLHRKIEMGDGRGGDLFRFQVSVVDPEIVGAVVEPALRTEAVPPVHVEQTSARAAICSPTVILPTAGGPMMNNNVPVTRATLAILGISSEAPSRTGMVALRSIQASPSARLIHQIVTDQLAGGNRAHDWHALYGGACGNQRPR